MGKGSDNFTEIVLDGPMALYPDYFAIPPPPPVIVARLVRLGRRRQASKPLWAFVTSRS